MAVAEALTEIAQQPYVTKEMLMELHAINNKGIVSKEILKNSGR